MNDLFEDKCPCCHRPYEASAPVGFAEFWALVPSKTGKEPSQKAWKRLSNQDRAEAVKHVKAFYAWFTKEYPTASLLMPSTYLNNKRWTDDAIKASAAPASEAIEALRRGLQSNVPAVREYSEAALKRINERKENE